MHLERLCILVLCSACCCVDSSKTVQVVDGVVNLTGLLTLGSGEGLKYFETGRAQFYALIVFGGVIAMVVLFGVLGSPIS